MPQNRQSKGNKTEAIGNKVNKDFLNGLHKKKIFKNINKCSVNGRVITIVSGNTSHGGASLQMGYSFTNTHFL